jgi:Kef-type K+ transport system membrane component KefB
MKKILSTLWGLLFDDARLAVTLLIALAIAAIASLVGHMPTLGAIVIWLGLIVALFISIEHQLTSKLRKSGK